MVLALLHQLVQLVNSVAVQAPGQNVRILSEDVRVAGARGHGGVEAVLIRQARRDAGGGLAPDDGLVLGLGRGMFRDEGDGPASFGVEVAGGGAAVGLAVLVAQVG